MKEVQRVFFSESTRLSFKDFSESITESHGVIKRVFYRADKSLFESRSESHSKSQSESHSNSLSDSFSRVDYRADKSLLESRSENLLEIC